MIGTPATKQEVDAHAGSLPQQLEQTFDRIRKMQAWLARTPNADLEAMGYTVDEVNNLKSTFTDLETLRLVFEGGAPPAQAKDFRTFGRRLFGIGIG